MSASVTPTSDICKTLIQEQWKKKDNISAQDKTPGIYAIGYELPNDTVYLYIGRSNALGRRIHAHFQESERSKQRINRVMKDDLDEDRIRVKWVRDEEQQTREGAYLTCVQDEIRYKPLFNKRGGDGGATA